jgi:hypothetical protein
MNKIKHDHRNQNKDGMDNRISGYVYMERVPYRARPATSSSSRRVAAPGVRLLLPATRRTPPPPGRPPLQPHPMPSHTAAPPPTAGRTAAPSTSSIDGEGQSPWQPPNPNSAPMSPRATARSSPVLRRRPSPTNPIPRQPLIRRGRGSRDWSRGRLSPLEMLLVYSTTYLMKWSRRSFLCQNRAL